MTKISFISPYLIRPFRINSRGVAVFEDVNGNLIQPNSEQCKAYGYRWNKDTETCEAYIVKPGWQPTNPSNFIKGGANELWISTNNSMIVGQKNIMKGHGSNNIILGDSNIANSSVSNSTILGYKGNATVNNTFTLGGNSGADIVGKRQMTYLIFGTQTDDDKENPSFLNNDVDSLYKIPVNAAVSFHIDILAIRVGGTAEGSVGDFQTWTEQGVAVMKQEGDIFRGTIQSTRTAITGEGNTEDWLPTPILNEDNFYINVKGASDQTIEWVSSIRLTQLQTSVTL